MRAKKRYTSESVFTDSEVYQLGCHLLAFISDHMFTLEAVVLIQISKCIVF